MVYAIEYRRAGHLMIARKEMLDSSICCVTACGKKFLAASETELSKNEDNQLQQTTVVCLDCSSYLEADSKIFDVLGGPVDA